MLDAVLSLEEFLFRDCLGGESGIAFLAEGLVLGLGRDEDGAQLFEGRYETLRGGGRGEAWREKGRGKGCGSL